MKTLFLICLDYGFFITFCRKFSKDILQQHKQSFGDKLIARRGAVLGMVVSVAALMVEPDVVMEL
jgi:hypothetical protein